MALLSQFITSMEEFLDEMSIQFPTNPKIKEMRRKFMTLKGTTPKMVLDEFREMVEEFKDAIFKKDESMLSDPDSVLVSEYGLDAIWKECSDGTKNAIWLHLQTLVLLSDNIRQQAENVLDGFQNTLPHLNPSAIGDLTEIAKNVEKKMNGKTPTVQDILSDQDTMGSIMAMADNILKGMK